MATLPPDHNEYAPAHDDRHEAPQSDALPAEGHITRPAGGYLAHFGLELPPFGTAPDPRFAYATRAHELALLKVQDSVEQRLGLCLLVGDWGMGKSTLAYLLLSTWATDPDRYAVAYLSDPSASTPAQFLRLLVASFGLEPSRFVEINKDVLQNFLLDCYAQNKTVVALLDEAQSIHASNMATIQHLSNIQAADTKLLQIALIGLPNLHRKLGYFPALQSRIARRSTLDPLIYDDTIEMMRHRLAVAGGDLDTLFAPDALQPLFNASAGIPRRVCVLADNALFQAFAHGQAIVSGDSVRAAVRDMGFAPDGGLLTETGAEKAKPRRRKKVATATGEGAETGETATTNEQR